ncbi:hypothetical protein BDQ12DRAFT_614940 [Crucibulum laeve]|uniref:MACPF domain-containing protein n=1 Tax=Crucibulum laeve TaxID=68775 RepID=A0A5C3LMN4_9AGAR|nr:hypothetical protein BDQ12DRAFT_614940 [Crucibulum laeve]
MALLLAPYNDAMRLGMGFNSFTQQLCINDAVKNSSNTSVLESELRPEYQRGGTTVTNQPQQLVNWTEKFVDRISEVTDSLNISGAMEIKRAGLGGSGSARAGFIDSNKFKESDLNYFIQVKVTNQKLVAPGLTDFCPISHISSSDFTRVYGDSFISGFQEGGEFNALVSIKLKDRRKAKEISGSLKIFDFNFDAKTSSVDSGEADGSKKYFDSSIDGETAISVSWTGGGDIKDESLEEWNLETLKKIALKFPEHVMARPMRTYAILTKYSALRNFHEREIKGSPLEYENVGMYSSTLLDAYMDYKIIWRNIQTGVFTSLYEVFHCMNVTYITA